MMNMRRLALVTFAAPLTLGLASCGADNATAGTDVDGAEAIAAIAAPTGQGWQQTAVITELGGIQMGNPDAPVKLVEYASHTCSHCATFSSDADAGIGEYVASGVVSFELRNQVHDPLDLTIATLVRCGDPATAIPLAKQAWSNLTQIIQTAQGNGDALSAAMASQTENRFQLIAEEAGLLDFFSQRGISRDQAMQCLSSQDVPMQIAENSATQSDELGVTGTPTFFVNGLRVDGTSWALVETALQAAGAQ